jgi:hypothetical protein
VSYAPVDELRLKYQTAARLHLSTPGLSIPDAAEEHGLNRSGSDYQGVRRWVLNFTINGMAKIIQMPGIAERVAAATAAVRPPAQSATTVPRAGAVLRTYSDIDSPDDFEDYAKAYRMIGKLMSGRKGKSWARCKITVERDTGWTIKKTSAFMSRAALGLEDPAKPGRKPKMGGAGEAAMVRAVNLLCARWTCQRCCSRASWITCRPPASTARAQAAATTATVRASARRKRSAPSLLSRLCAP